MGIGEIGKKAVEGSATGGIAGAGVAAFQEATRGTEASGKAASSVTEGAATVPLQSLII
jgi:hypothetical protein